MNEKKRTFHLKKKWIEIFFELLKLNKYTLKLRDIL